MTFLCRISGATPLVRLPGESTFGITLPPNVMVSGMDEVTFTVVNAQRSENSTAFRCGGGGQFTNTGVLNVYCKLYHWIKKMRERKKLEYFVLSFDLLPCLEPWNQCLPQRAVYLNECAFNVSNRIPSPVVY